MQPAKGLSTAQPVKTAAVVAIAQKMVVPAAYAAKKERPRRITGPFTCFIPTFSYLTMIFCTSLELSFLSVTISM